MSERMHLIPFPRLISWALAEFRQSGTVFGVPVRQSGDAGGWSTGSTSESTGFESRIPVKIGLAAGPHTQLAQNIIAGYVAGARVFELKTVQRLDGEDLKVDKPCIAVPDEGYNVEWSTELRVPDAMEEYVKAWFALHVLARELALGDPGDISFNMSVGYDLPGIQSDKIDTLINGLADASGTSIWQDCRAFLTDRRDLLQRFGPADLDDISPRICPSVTLSTLHGCPASDIEAIASYLLTVKRLNTFVKLNPTLLGYDFARRTFDRLGYSDISFDDHHFLSDLQFDDAIPMIRRLQAVAAANGRTFGVKLSNTLPVEIRRQELPGQEMYLSGRALFPLTINLAARLAEAFDGQIRISYCGGADAFNCVAISQTGIWPITVTTTLLKPGGYARLSQIADLLEQHTPYAQADASAQMAPVREASPSETDHGINVAGLRALADQAIQDPAIRRRASGQGRRKLNRKVPLLDCFTAPCVDGCPFGQDAPAYIRLLEDERPLAALAVITERNPLPFTTGQFCDHRCMARCTRNDYDEPVRIRDIKRSAASQAMDALLSRMVPVPVTRTARAACLGGTPSGLTAAWFLTRNGFETTVFEKAALLGHLGRPVTLVYRQAVEQDLVLLRQAGVRFSEELDDLTTTDTLKSRGYDIVFDARYADQQTGSIAEGIATGIRAADQILRQQTGEPLRFTSPIGSEPESNATHPELRRSRIVTRKSRLARAANGDATGDCARCLSCDLLCKHCVEVCPNRANVLVRVLSASGRVSDQIIHLDGPCNACGNCTPFCPYDSAPYREKFTIFWTEPDFDASSADGILQIDRDRRLYQVRQNGMVRIVRLPDVLPYSIADLPDGAADLILAVVQNHDWLFV